MGKELKYGQIKGGEVSTSVIMTTGQTFRANSAAFVYMNAGLGVIADDGQDQILGHAETDAHTTVAGEKVKVVVDPTAVYRIPIVAGTYVEAMKGDTCDIIVTSNIQGADLTAADDDIFLIIDGDLENNEWVDVMLTPKELGQVGVV